MPRVKLATSIPHELSVRSRPKFAAGSQRRPRMASTSACSPAAPRRWICCSSTATMTAGPRASFRIDPAAEPHLSLLARVRAGPSAGQIYGYRVHGPYDPANGLWFDPAQSPARSIRPGRCCSEELQSRRCPLARRQRVVGDEEHGGRSGRLRLGRRHARYATRPRGPSFTRCTSADSRGIPVPEFRTSARHVCRTDRENSLSPATRHHRGRVAAGVSVRRSGRPARAGQLLGLFTGLVLCAASRLQLTAGSRSARSTSSATWSRRCTAQASK